ncbi:hypothetical protein HK101_007031, partial [Irineochytrium annulatum]
KAPAAERQKTKSEPAPSKTVFSAAPAKNPEPLIDFFSSLDDELTSFSGAATQATFSVNVGPGAWDPTTASSAVNTPFGMQGGGMQGVGMQGLGMQGMGMQGGGMQGMGMHGAPQSPNQFQFTQAPQQQQQQMVGNPFGMMQPPEQNNALVLASSGLGGGRGGALSSGANPFSAPPQQQQHQQQQPSFGAQNSFTIENVFGNSASFDQQPPTPQFASHQQPQAFGGFPSSQPQNRPNQPLAIMGGPAKTSEITDHLVALNPFAKPSVPLAAMGSNNATPIGMMQQNQFQSSNPYASQNGKVASPTTNGFPGPVDQRFGLGGAGPAFGGAGSN